MKNKITILGNLIFDNWFLFVINTLIYIYSLYLELKYIFVDDFYRLSVYKRYGNEEEFLKSFIRKIFRFSKLFMDANTRYWNCFVYNNMHILGL